MGFKSLYRECRQIKEQWTRRLLPRLLVLPLPQGLLVTRGRQLQQLLACQVEGTGQTWVRELKPEQHLGLLELLLVIMVDPARRRRRKTRDLDQRRRRKRIKRGLGQGRRRRRRRREAGLDQEAPPAALDQTPTDLTLSVAADDQSAVLVIFVKNIMVLIVKKGMFNSCLCLKTSICKFHRRKGNYISF